MPAGCCRTAAALAAVVAACLMLVARLEADDRANQVITMPTPEHGKPASAKIDSDGAIHLLYCTPDGPRYAKSTDGGKSFSRSIPVVDRASRKPGLQFDVWDMAIGQGGSVHVALGTNAWKLKLPQNEWGFLYAQIESGANEFSPVRNLNHKPSEGFSLAADDKGNVTACWLAGKLYANVSHDNGKTFSAAEINPAYDPCNCCTTSAAFAPDGKLAVLYREKTNNERDMHLILWDQKSNQSSRNRISTTLWKINACPMTYYSVCPAPGGFVAAWPTGDDYDIYFARLDEKGNMLTPGEIRTPGRAGHRTGVLALSKSDGSALVAWSKDSRLGWQLYDAQGEPSGPSESATNSGDGVAGVVDKNGHFVLFR